MSISPELITEFKERMHLGDHEDEKLGRILSASEAALKRECGDYDIYIDETFKELVFERSRYVYNDALEYFHMNFLSQINSLGVDKALEHYAVEEDSDAAV
ncbi:hypothetical protein SFC50_25775 [Bacillus infantis]|uniref:hypothetical protein n=1 Tax=Bacillus infantis TaxID=324767 RepID=UPI0039827F10